MLSTAHIRLAYTDAITCVLRALATGDSAQAIRVFAYLSNEEKALPKYQIAESSVNRSK